jgi:sugar phosphate isomerase/epimerase
MIRTISRRSFVRLVSGLAASAAIPGIAQRGWAAQGADPWGGWPIGVQSYSLRNYNTHDAIRHIQGMDVHFVEFTGNHLSVGSSDEQIAEVKQLCASAGVKANAHGVNRFTKDHEANRRLFVFAKKAGIRNLTADPDPDSFDSLDKLCAEYDVRIAIHNHGPKHRYNLISDVAKAVQGHHPHVGACVDTGHFIRSKQDPVQAVRELKGRVFALHLKDDEKQDGSSHNVILGKAHLDVPGLFRALKETAFPQDGSLSLEYEANPMNPIDDMKMCLAVVKEAIAKAAS